MKRQLSNDTDFTRCIICQSTTEHNPNNLTENGFGAFRHAVEQRHEDVYDRLWTLLQDEETFLSMKPICHRTWRSVYTNKKTIAKQSIKKAKSEENIHGTAGDLKTRSSSSASKVTYKSRCFICKKQRDAKGKWQLLPSRNKKQYTKRQNKLMMNQYCSQYRVM